MKRKKLALIATLFSMTALMWPQEYRVALKELPTTRFYEDLLDAIADKMDLKLKVDILPSARADYLMINDRVDVEVPMLGVEEIGHPRRHYDFGTAVLYQSAFVLFSVKGKTVDIADLKAGNSKRYEIESDISIANQLGFAASPSTSIEGSLKKTNEGKIDGYIFSQTSTNPVAGNLSLPNVKRRLYAYFPLYYALRKGERGGVLDKLMSEGINRLKDDGTYDRIMGELIAAARYDDWQP